MPKQPRPENARIKRRVQWGLAGDAGRVSRKTRKLETQGQARSIAGLGERRSMREMVSIKQNFSKGRGGKCSFESERQDVGGQRRKPIDGKG